MLVGTVYPPKEPGDNFPVGVDFAGDLMPGETIVSAQTTAKDVYTGQDATSSFLAGADLISGTVVTHRVRAGTSGKKYRVQFHITTSAANEYEHEVDVPVKEL